MVLYLKTVLLLKYFDGVVFKDDGIDLIPHAYRVELGTLHTYITASLLEMCN